MSERSMPRCSILLMPRALRSSRSILSSWSTLFSLNSEATSKISNWKAYRNSSLPYSRSASLTVPSWLILRNSAT